MVSNTLLSTGGGVTTWIFVGLLVVLVIVLLVVPMFTNKKRAKQTMDLHNSLMPGDVIKTVGGVIGTIKEIKQVSPTEREMIIETGEGDNKTTMTFDIQALYQILERAARPEPAEVFPSEEEAHSEALAEEKPVETAEEAKAEEPVVAEEAVAAEAVAEPEAAETAKAVEEQAATEVAEEQAATEAAEEKPNAAPKAKKAGSSNSAGKKKSTAKNSEKN